jgi:hypothetical protein
MVVKTQFNIDALRLQALQQAGVEIREGQRLRIREDAWGKYVTLWLRRPGVST